jgi:uncharacterized protein YkwD
MFPEALPLETREDRITFLEQYYSIYLQYYEARQTMEIPDGLTSPEQHYESWLQNRNSQFCFLQAEAGFITAVRSALSTQRAIERMPEIIEQARTATRPEDEQEMLRLINEFRISEGRHPLIWHDGVAHAARAHALDTHLHGTGSDGHTGSDRTGPDERVARLELPGFRAGHTRVRENWGRGTDSSPQAQFNRWIDSSGHRNAILTSDSAFTAIGIGAHEGVWIMKIVAPGS